jgi:hypothetical protein
MKQCDKNLHEQLRPHSLKQHLKLIILDPQAPIPPLETIHVLYHWHHLAFRVRWGGGFANFHLQVRPIYPIVMNEGGDVEFQCPGLLLGGGQLEAVLKRVLLQVVKGGKGMQKGGLEVCI